MKAVSIVPSSCKSTLQVALLFANAIKTGQQSDGGDTVPDRGVLSFLRETERRPIFFLFCSSSDCVSVDYLK